MNRRSGLGRGLAALIPPDAELDDGTGVRRAVLREVPIASIRPNPAQPRRVFDEEELQGLATSIMDMGILQPLVVRPVGDEGFELVAGERRLRASRLAGLATVPVVVRHTDDADLLKEALVENIHRVQLNPLEEAAAYQQLLDDFEFTQEELARRLGKSRPAISNALRLLSLPGAVQRKVAAGVLSAGHAKALLALSGAAQQEAVAERIVSEGMSVRATEELVRAKVLDGPQAESHPATSRRPKLTSPALNDLQDQLSDALMSRVRISMGKRTGNIAIQFASIADLERLVDVISAGIQSTRADA